MNLPSWASELMARYESGAGNQFVLHGNVEDRFVLPESNALGSLSEFLLSALLGRFDVVLSYDLGNGIRIEKGREIFSQWPAYKANPTLPREAASGFGSARTLRTLRRQSGAHRSTRAARRRRHRSGAIGGAAGTGHRPGNRRFGVVDSRMEFGFALTGKSVRLDFGGGKLERFERFGRRQSARGDV